MGGDDVGHRTCISVYNSVSCYNYSNKRKYRTIAMMEYSAIHRNGMLQGNFRRIQTRCPILVFYNRNSISVWIASAYGWILYLRMSRGVPTYKFDFPTMLISLACFITIYEIDVYIF